MMIREERIIRALVEMAKNANSNVHGPPMMLLHRCCAFGMNIITFMYCLLTVC